MEDKKYTESEKDLILCNAFSKLQPVGIKSKWAISLHPFTELRDECNLLMADSAFVGELQNYLQSHAILLNAMKMFFTQIAMSARAQWYNVPDEIRPITARGWFLGRWIPTFLIIDGPIGRFFSIADSPLYMLLRDQPSKYPLLTSARDLLKTDLFRKLRNGFGHWAFDWEIIGADSYVIAYDWQTGLPTAKLHQEQADAFHIVAFALIEVLDECVISKFRTDHI
jgi:hypothetical protein